MTNPSLYRDDSRVRHMLDAMERIAELSRVPSVFRHLRISTMTHLCRQSFARHMKPMTQPSLLPMGFDKKLSEMEIVAKLFEMYVELTKGAE